MSSKPNFSNVLLLSNLGVDMGLPSFRLGSYTKTLVPMARLLEKQSGISACLLANEYIAHKLREDAASSGAAYPKIFTIDSDRISASQADDFMVKSYSKTMPVELVNNIHDIILAALNGWKPDVIISWEAPTNIFRSLFPDATVIDIMPGMFMRPPYPSMISFDPVGLYSNCWFSKSDVESITVSDGALGNYVKIRDLYTQHYDMLDVPNALVNVLNRTKLDRSTLVPLQVSQYFGWRDNTNYDSQFNMVTDVQRHLPENTHAVYTQYLGNLTGDRVFNSENLEYLRGKYSNFVYNGQLEKLDNITQYLLPKADTVISVSSTLGLQAKFFGKKLISPSSSHLSYVADGTNITSFDSTPNKSRDSFMAAYLGRTNILRDRLLNEPSYLVNILNNFVERRDEAGIEKFPSFDVVGNTAHEIAKRSSLKRSKQLFTNAYPVKQLPHDRRVDSQIEAVTSEKIQTVSFDVFDTLVCRTVLNPVDVFELMQARLKLSHKDILSPQFISNFAQFRAGTERLIRYELDNSISPESEEMHIHSVYTAMLSDHGLPARLADELVEIEQDTELECLIPRREGVTLFKEAVSAGKQTIIISDFIHPTSFVERVLRQCGVDGWDHIFVSSDVGLKKHSGSLFKYVETTLGLNKHEICHIGDNAHGDIKMAKSCEWGARHVPAAPLNIRTLLKARKFNIAAVSGSLVVRAILSGFGNHFLKFGGSRNINSKDVQLIANEREMGFLLLGPFMHSFAKWLLDEVEKNDCKQIIFFARDTILPYKMMRHILDNNNFSNINVRYIPISRMASSGLDIQTVEDIHKVRIDDFEVSKSLIELLETRFHLQRLEIDTTEVAKWTSKSLDKIKVSDIPPHAIYRIAKSSASLNWALLQPRMDEKRRIFQSALEQWGCDTQCKTIAVDFGYKGSIHKKVSGFFKEPLLARFFMSYADTLGHDPIDDCKSFYLSKQVSKYKQSDPMMRYNLLIETMINEGVGSALGYYDDNGVIRVLHENSVDSPHADIITNIHGGALEFAHYWEKYCNIIDKHANIEPQMLSFLLAEVLKSPTVIEAKILAGLTFDNGYAGHKPRSIIELDKAGYASNGVWPEGVNILRNRVTKTPVQKQGEHPVKLPETRHTLVRFIISRFGNDRLLKKFDRDPRLFFNDSSRPFVRQIGNIVLR